MSTLCHKQVRRVPVLADETYIQVAQQGLTGQIERKHKRHTSAYDTSGTSTRKTRNTQPNGKYAATAHNNARKSGDKGGGRVDHTSSNPSPVRIRKSACMVSAFAMAYISLVRRTSLSEYFGKLQ